MAQLGQAFLAVNKNVLGMMVDKNFPVSALSGPKVQQDGSVAPVASFGFQFASDLTSLVASSAADDAFLRIDLNAVLDIVDTIGCDVVAEAGIDVIPGHDRFAFGVDPFDIAIADFEASHDGQTFVPAPQFNLSAQTVEIEEEIADLAEALDATAATEPSDTIMVESVDASAVELNPAEEATAAPATAIAPAEAMKTYTTPYMPRGQWLKMMRETGQLQPRQPRETLPITLKTNPAGTERQPKRVRNPNELGAIRRFYATKGKKSA